MPGSVDRSRRGTDHRSVVGRVCGRPDADQRNFAEISRSLVNKTLVPVRKALRDAQLTIDDIHGVVMVGAPRACRKSAGQWRLFRPGTAHQSRPGQGGRPGRGDSGQCAGRQPQRRRLAAAGRDPLSLGLETMGGLVGKSFRATRRFRLPAHRSSPPTKDGQTALAIPRGTGESASW